MKRVISLLLALALVLGNLPFASFADEVVPTHTVSLSADKETVMAGEEITLTLSISEALENAFTWQWNILYDSNLFEVVSMAKPATAYKYSGVNKDPVDKSAPADPYQYALVYSGTKLELHTIPKGDMCTLTLKAKANITEEISSYFFVNCNAVTTGEEVEDASGNWTVDFDDYAALETQYSCSDLSAIPTEGGLSVAVTPAEYNITIGSMENGSVTVSPEKAAAGEEITLTVTPTEGYELGTLTVMAGETEVTVTDNKFKMPASAVTVNATFVETSESAVTVTLNETALNLSSFAGSGELYATVTGSDASVVWDTTDENVALIYDISGGVYVEGIGPGECDITATVDGVTATCHVVVTDPVLDSFPFTITVDGTDVEAVADGTERCDYGQRLYKYVVTVPADAKIMHLSYDNESAYIFPDHGDEYLLEGGVDCDVDLTKGYKVLDLWDAEDPNLMIHLHIEYAEPEYDITIGSMENGSVTASPEKAAEGEEITLTVTPAEGYELENLTVKAGETDVSVTDNKFTMPASAVTVNATFIEYAEPEKIPVTGVTLSVSEHTLDAIGGEFVLVATITPSNATNQEVVWATSDANVATVENGYIKAVGGGNCEITATVDDVTATCVVTVIDPRETFPFSVSVNGEDLEATYVGTEKCNTSGERALYEVTVPADATSMMIYYDGEAMIIQNEADKEKLAQKVSEYEVDLTAGYEKLCIREDNRIRYHLAINVAEPEKIPVNGVGLSETSVEMALNSGVKQLEATVSPDNATNKTVTWSSNNEAVATVNGAGIIYSHSVGEAVITATADGVSATCNVTVYDPATRFPYTLTINGEELEVTAKGTTTGCMFGEQSLFEVTVPANATEMLITFDGESMTVVDDSNGAPNIIVANVIEYTLDLTQGYAEIHLADNDNNVHRHVRINVEKPEEYEISIGTMENGSVTASHEKAVAGQEITLTVTPSTGYKLDTLTVMAGETEVEVTDNKFTMPASAVIISASFKEIKSALSQTAASRTEDVENEAGATESVTIEKYISAVAGANITVTVDEGEATVQVEIPHTIITFPSTAENITLTYPLGVLKLYDAPQTFSTESQPTQYAELTSDTGTIYAPATVSSDTVILDVPNENLSGTYTLTGNDDQPLEALTFNQVAEGYYFTTSADTVPDEQNTVAVTVKVIGHSDNVETFNAYDLTVTYESGLVYSGFAGTADGDDVSVTKEENSNTIHVVGAGANKAIGTNVVTLKFKMADNASGTKEVKVTAAKVSDRDASTVADAPPAQATADPSDPKADDTPDTTVVATRYTVDRPDFVEVSGDAIHGKPFSFWYQDNDPTHFEYTGLKVTNGTDVLANLTAVDGKYTIESVQGNLKIEVTQNRKTYEVDFQITDAVVKIGELEITETAVIPVASYGNNYTFQVTADGKSISKVQYKIGEAENAEPVNCAYDQTAGVYYVPGEAIVGKVTILVVASTEGNTDIEFSGSGSSLVQGGITQTVPAGQPLTVTLNEKKDGYLYSVRVGDTKISANDDGTYTIPANVVQAGLKVTVLEAKLVVNVVNYFDVEGKSMFLVKAKATANEMGEADTVEPIDLELAYGGAPMYFSDRYTVTDQVTAENGETTKVESTAGVYSWLVFTTEELPGADEIKAAAMATIVENTAAMTDEQKAEQTVAYDNNVNGSTNVDVNDAQLVYDMYKGQYTEFTDNLTMKKFLEADLSDVVTQNGSLLNTSDVMVIIDAIIKAK